MSDYRIDYTQDLIDNPYRSSPVKYTWVNTYEDHLAEMAEWAEQQKAEIAAERINEAVLVYGRNFY